MNKRRITVRGVLFKDDKLLAVKHKTEDGGEADYWAIPGGGLDPAESLKDGVKRELLEEMGISAQVGTLLFVQQYRDEKREYLEFFFHIENPEDFVAIDLTTTTHGDDEIARIKFIDPRNEYILPAFLSTIDIARAINGDQPVFIYNGFERPAV